MLAKKTESAASTALIIFVLSTLTASCSSLVCTSHKPQGQAGHVKAAQACLVKSRTACVVGSRIDLTRGWKGRKKTNKGEPSRHEFGESEGRAIQR